MTPTEFSDQDIRDLTQLAIRAHCDSLSAGIVVTAARERAAAAAKKSTLARAVLAAAQATLRAAS